MATPNISEAISFTLAKMNTWGAAIATLGNQEAFIAILIYILGLMAGLSVFTITMMQSMRQEEKDHYADMLLSRPVSRFKWMGSYLTVAFAGSALILLILGLASGIGWSIASGELAHISRVLGMSLFQELSIVPLIVLTAIAVALTWLGVIGFKRRSIG